MRRRKSKDYSTLFSPLLPMALLLVQTARVRQGRINLMQKIVSGRHRARSEPRLPYLRQTRSNDFLFILPGRNFLTYVCDRLLQERDIHRKVGAIRAPAVASDDDRVVVDPLQHRGKRTRDPFDVDTTRQASLAVENIADVHNIRLLEINHGIPIRVSVGVMIHFNIFAVKMDRKRIPESDARPSAFRVWP